MCNINQLQRGCAICKCNRDTRSVWLTCYSSPNNEIQLCVFFLLKKKKTCILLTLSFRKTKSFINRFLAEGIKYLKFYKFNGCNKCILFFIFCCTKFLLDKNFVYKLYIFRKMHYFSNCLGRTSVYLKLKFVPSSTKFVRIYFVRIAK